MFELSPEDKALASNFVKGFNLMQRVHKDTGAKVMDYACYLGSSFPIIGQGCFLAANSARQAVVVEAVDQLGKELLTKQTTIKYFKTNLERELKVLKTRIEEEKKAQEKKIWNLEKELQALRNFEAENIEKQRKQNEQEEENKKSWKAIKCQEVVDLEQARAYIQTLEYEIIQTYQDLSRKNDLHILTQALLNLEREKRQVLQINVDTETLRGNKNYAKWEEEYQAHSSTVRQQGFLQIKIDRLEQENEKLVQRNQELAGLVPTTFPTSSWWRIDHHINRSVSFLSEAIGDTFIASKVYIAFGLKVIFWVALVGIVWTMASFFWGITSFLGLFTGLFRALTWKKRSAPAPIAPENETSLTKQ